MKDNPIIVALDTSSAIEAFKLAERLKGAVGGLKVGSQLFTAAGPVMVRQLIQDGWNIFLDLKYHDIPNTVASAATEAAKLGARMFNVHTSGGVEMMKAAKAAAVTVAKQCGKDQPLVLGVTMLTSLDETTSHDIGFGYSVAAMVERLAGLAVKAGLDGLVCSAQEIGAIRRNVSREIQLVVPGIRLPQADHQDQKRTGTPVQAMADGANWLVIGRPITGAADPRAAAEEILATLN